MLEQEPPDVGRRLRELRERRGLSLRALADRSGLSVNAVSLSGQVQYAVNGQVYTITEGDALLFQASLPHYWCNPTCDTARILLVLEAVEGRGTPLLPHLEA